MSSTDSSSIAIGADVVAFQRNGDRRQRRRFVDRDQIAAKLSVKRSDFSATLLTRPPLPEPVGYFRGRVLWDEQEIDEWVAAHTRD